MIAEDHGGDAEADEQPADQEADPHNRVLLLLQARLPHVVIFHPE